MKTDSKYKPGQSGNPKGRPPGPSKIGKLRSSIEKDVPGIIAALTTSALNGDPVSAKLLLDRIMPILKPESRQSMPAPTDPDSILQAVEAGAIGLDQATALMALATARIKIAEATELIQRLDALEALLHKG